MANDVFANFRLCSVGIGKVEDELAVRIGTPDEATAAALLRNYPPGSRIDDVLVGITVFGVAVLHAAAPDEGDCTPSLDR